MAAIKRLIHLRPASTSCAHVSILLSDARNVASSVKQFQSFQRRLSSRVRSVIKSALSPCSGLGSHQEAFLSIKFISLRPRNGSRRVMVNLTAPESVLAVQIPVLAHRQDVFAGGKASPSASTQTSNRLICEGEIQCRTNLYLYIECISHRLSLPAFWEFRAAHVRFTPIACRIPVKIVSRARP